jgi:dTDP-4-dehydrorhamnose reductase
MRVFVTGSTGLLGSSLLRNTPKGVTLGASYNKNKLVPNLSCKYYQVDITKKTLVNKAIKDFKPDIVIHTAAIATPDYCDKHKEEAREVNIEGTKNIIQACKENNSALVFITTNGVYDGKKAPYDEQALPKPIDYYGKTKYRGEKLTSASGIPFIIIRLITMYGWNNPQERQNPLTWLIDILGKNKTPVNIVTDMYNNFLSAESASEAIWKAVEEKHFGETYNIAGKECISRYDFSKEIVRIFGLDHKMLYPVKLSFFKNFVPRPKNTCFVTDKMASQLKVKPIPMKKGLLYLRNNPLLDTAWKELP